MNTFYIPEPCHEKWDKMRPEEKGRHCEVCSKVVVDFTRKTPQEIDTLIGNAQGNVCGHFSLNQLDQQAQLKVFRRPGNLFNRNWKYFVMATLGFFALNKKTEAQKTVGKIRLAGKPAATVHHNQNTSQKKVYGTVYAPNQQTAGGARLFFYSGESMIGETTAMANGTYTFTIPAGEISGNNISIRVMHRYYREKIVNGLAIVNNENRLNIVLEEEIMMLGQVVSTKTLFPQDTLTPDQLNADSAAYTSLEEICMPKLPENDSLPAVAELEKEIPADPTERKDTTGTDPSVSRLAIRDEDIRATIYPNPAGTYATIQCQDQSQYEITLFDAKGTLFMRRSFHGDRTDLDVSALAQGTYFVRVSNANGHQYSLKLVKQ